MSVVGHSAVSMMNHRATVQRDGASGTDDWGNPNIPSYAAHIASQRCYVWIRTKKDVSDEGKTALVDETRMMIPLGVDVLREDRITAIKDRAGTTLLAGNYQVVSVDRMDTHQELLLEKIS